MSTISRITLHSCSLLCAGLLAACGGNSSSDDQTGETFLDERVIPLYDSTTIGTANCPPLRGDEDTSAIAGLYISTEINTGGQDGISYISISTTGDYVEYVYEEINTCYNVDSIGEFIFRPLAGDDYQQIEYANADQDCTLDISEPITFVLTATTLTTEGGDDYFDVAPEPSPSALALCS